MTGDDSGRRRALPGFADPSCGARNESSTSMKRLLLTLLAAFTFASPLFPQGALTPLNPPAPTMKKLDELEPRTNLQATPAPAGVDTSNASFHYVINQPGSYYLSANLAVTKAHGIQINAAGVTLDLNGFEIARESGTIGQWD